MAQPFLMASQSNASNGWAHGAKDPKMGGKTFTLDNQFDELRDVFAPNLLL